MKKKILTWVIIVAVLLTLIAIFSISLDGWVLASQVESVEFRGFDSCELPAKDRVELTSSEVHKLIFYYNLASYAGEVTADDCNSDFGFVIDLADGTRIVAREAGSSRIRVSLPNGRACWLKSKALTHYAMKLIEKYELPGPYPTGQ